MRAYLWYIKVKKGSKRLDIAREQRKGEEPILQIGLEWLRKQLDKVGRKQKSQPYVIKHLSEGATSLSVEEEWGSKIDSVVESLGGFLINFLNIGDQIGSIPDEEYLKRREVILSHLVNERGSPPLILTTGCYRSGEDILYDKSSFDERYLEAVYILDRCAVGKPLKNDLSDLLRRGTIHTITTPVEAVDFEAFMTNQFYDVSFMFAGTLGTGISAPPLSEAEDRVDGIVLIGNTEDYLRNIMLSLEGKWPGCPIVAYALAEVKEPKLSLPFIPTVRDKRPIKGWGREKFMLFFTAALNTNDVEEALERAREILQGRVGEQ